MSSSKKAKEKEPKEKRTKETKEKAQKSKGSFLAIVMAILCIFAIVFLVISVNNRFDSAYDAAKDQAYQNAYDKSFDYYERKNHVSNNATLTIGDIQEKNELEVLTVSDAIVEITEPEDSKNGKRWTEYTAMGVYTVDLNASEFITDSSRGFIIAKLKTPELKNIALDKVQVLNYDKEGFKNGNIDTGSTEALEDRKSAQEKLSAALRNNAGNDEKAKESAEMFVREFLKNVNADWHLSDEDIQIEFT